PRRAAGSGGGAGDSGSCAAGCQSQRRGNPQPAATGKLLYLSVTPRRIRDSAYRRHERGADSAAQRYSSFPALGKTLRSGLHYQYQRTVGHRHRQSPAASCGGAGCLASAAAGCHDLFPAVRLAQRSGALPGVIRPVRRSTSRKSLFHSLICLTLTFFVSVAHANTCLSSPRLTGVNIAGAEFNAKRLPGVIFKDYTYPKDSELAYIAAQGANVIRLPFRWERLQPE